ncbi:MAG: sodium:proton antiporter NhaD [Prolixibacteraceae bacterium]|nr:sodium:proton antiporter NhaD [Prolixibacteraceae bacterium]
MFYLILIIFILGYLAIALEHPLKIDKAATALIIGVLTWTVYILNAESLLQLGFSPSWHEFVSQAQSITDHIKPTISDSQWINSEWAEKINVLTHPYHFVVEELEHHLIEIAEILFFLLGAMTIVEIIDQHEGFKVITDRITTTHKVKLLWIIVGITFFMSAVLDNLTTTIVMVALLKKLINDKKTRWFFVSMVVLAANSGGAWSPIGDVTTIMLWIGGQVTAFSIIAKVILPSMVSILVPLTIISFFMKGSVERPKNFGNESAFTSFGEQMTVFIIGVGLLLFVPVFKTVTHLPPFMGMLFGLGALWIVTEIMHRKKPLQVSGKLKVYHIIQNVDTSTVLFFLGILSAVACLQSVGHLNIMAGWLNDKLGNVYAINMAIGVLSSIVDNVPLVAGAMGMYDIALPGATGYEAMFVQDGTFWELLAYCAGTGGSILIIGSAAGVAAMGIEKIDFIWYMKKISLLALAGYFSGIATFYLMFG